MMSGVSFQQRDTHLATIFVFPQPHLEQFRSRLDGVVEGIIFGHGGKGKDAFANGCYERAEGPLEK
jgi:hypothetical protein